MAARFWRTVLAVQLALATGIALGIGMLVPNLGASWLLAAGTGAFVAIQFLFVTFTWAASRALATTDASPRDFLHTLRAVLAEPYYFALAGFAMCRTPGSVARGSARPAASRSPLLLVHGLACNAGVWRRLVTRLRAAGFDCIRTVTLEPMQAGIDALARELAREILALHREHEGGIVVVAHSMGGLVARAALQVLDAASVRGLVTVATPHHGAALARMSHRPPIAEIRDDSAWLAALNALQEGQLPVPVTVISSREDNFVQPAVSPHLRGARLLELRGLGHFGLLWSRRGIEVTLHAIEEVA